MMLYDVVISAGSHSFMECGMCGVFCGWIIDLLMWFYFLNGRCITWGICFGEPDIFFGCSLYTSELMA